MQDRVTRSSGENFSSPDQYPGSSRTTPVKTEPQSNGWLFRKCLTSAWILLGASAFGALIVCSELVVTNFRAFAAEPTNAPLDNVLLDFTAKWCGPCQQMSPVVSRLERQNFPIRKVDIDVEKGLARQFNVDSIPCFVLVANGREINRITGLTDEKELRRLMALLPRQNIDDSMIAKNTRQNALNIPSANSSTRSPDEKKPFLRMPPLFSRNQEKDRDQDLALTPTSPPDTVRGQNQDAASEGFARDPMNVSIRIRVKDGSRLHYGSGTIIESQSGRSVALTCGHIFRDLGKEAVIEVDLFAGGNSKPQTVVGQVIRYDLKSDLGLIGLATKNPIPVIRLSSLQGAPSLRDRVLSVGCGGGERPTREDHVVTAVNKYVGPENIECDGVPQQGRSGGGLFLNSELIGVCIAADPKEKRGIYTSMKPVAQLLEKAQLGHLVPSYATNDQALADAGASSQGATLGNAVELVEESPRQPDDEIASILEAATRGNGNAPVSSGDYVGAEIVCIVRPKTPGATTRVVIVNQASSRFIDDLLHEPSSSNRGDSTVQKNPSNKSQTRQTVTKSSEAGSRMPMQKPPVQEASFNDDDGPIETSFQPLRYRRKRD